MFTARTLQTFATICVCTFTFCLCLTGCGRDNDKSPEPAPLAVPGKAATEPGIGQLAKPTPSDPLRQSFKDATSADPPEDQWLLEVTKTNKSVGKLYEAVVADWDKVQLKTPEGKKLAYSAIITTDLGTVIIELWPEVAPNHVRNFVALARAGFYDGLAFDRAIKREEGNGQFFECLECGCPAGTGDPTYGSIGYWLKPEFNLTVTHEPGTIGAWHGADVESAACKFYINLSKAEWMDGHFTLFGKVTKGLDVVRAIHGRPVNADGQQDRPREPVLMRSVIISSSVKE